MNSRARILWIAFVAFFAVIAFLVGPTEPSGASAGTENASADDTELSDFTQVSLDGTLTDRHAKIFRLYWAFFGREPDPTGARYWIEQVNRCVDPDTISNAFAGSEEFIGRYGPLDNEAFVELIYHNVLGRRGDRSGVQYWTSLVDHGVLTKGGVVLHVSLSSEFTSRRPYPSDQIADRQCHRPDGHPTGRTVDVTHHKPLASAAGITVFTPSNVIEHAGFHESTHPGALAMASSEPASVRISTMASRNRGTSATGAIDIVSEPNTPITAPVSGRVARAGEYTLYCKYTDGYVVINPDERPDLEVKILHMQGVQVRAGQKVAVGDLIGSHATLFPFRSQIDDLTAEDSWPHVHIEIVDPSVPRKPSSGKGC